MENNSEKYSPIFVRPPFKIIKSDNRELIEIIDISRSKVLADPQLSNFYIFFDNIRHYELKKLSALKTINPGNTEYYLLQKNIIEEGKFEIISFIKNKTNPYSELVTLTQNDAPTYYENYGDKFKEKFLSLKPSPNTSPIRLSAAGILWRNNTLKALQETNEILKSTDPALFLTLNYAAPNLYKDYCFDIHPLAYIESGFFKLPTSDATAVALLVTTDISALKPESFKQIFEITSKYSFNWKDNVSENFRKSLTYTGRISCNSSNIFCSEVNYRLSNDVKPRMLDSYYQDFLHTLVEYKSLGQDGLKSKRDELTSATVIGKQTFISKGR